MKPANLFATPIALFDDLYSDPQEVVDAALEAARGQPTPSGWQCSIQTTFKSDGQFASKLPLFKDIVTQAACQYSQLHWSKDCRVESSWANVAGSYQYQERHDHMSESIHMTKFSAVYYSQCQDNEQIAFHSPYQLITMLDRSKNIVSINAKRNRLILFPSYLEHSFKALERTIEKVSVAFNFILV